MADAPWKTWVAGLPVLSGSLQATDLVAVIRSGVSYQATGDKILPSVPTDQPVPTADNAFYHRNDFGLQTASLTATTITGDTVFQMSGTGTAVSFADQLLKNSVNATGVAYCQSGTTTTGRAFIKSTATFRIIDMPSGNEDSFLTRLLVSDTALSNGTDRYAVLAGIMPSPGAYSATQVGIYFVYSDDINSGKWQAVICDGTNTTTADTGVTAQITSFSKFKITVDKRTSGGNGIRFYIDGVLVATIAATVTAFSYFTSTTGLYLAGTVGIFKRAGTNVLSTGVDYIQTIHYRA